MVEYREYYVEQMSQRERDIHILTPLICEIYGTNSVKENRDNSQEDQFSFLKLGESSVRTKKGLL